MSPIIKVLAVLGLSLLAAIGGNTGDHTTAAATPGYIVQTWSAARQTAPCVADALTLCLNGGRFQVRVNWRVPSQGTSGVGTAVTLTSDTGYFWFFSSTNVELVIKVLDGRGVNGMYWVFYGALSDVAYTITVTDTATGAVRAYSNASGTLASVADTSAFAGGSSSRTEPVGSSLGAVPLAPLEGPCVAGSLTLCLNNGRFQVEVSWRVPSQGTSGSGTAVPLTSDTGYFWFFSNTNVELVIKALDGTPVNGQFWIFYGALSDVEYTLTVTDTATGAVKKYVNASGNLASVADTSAFSPAPTPTQPNPTATPTPNPTPTPTQSSSNIRVVNVGQGGNLFKDAQTGSTTTTIRVGDTVLWNWVGNTHSTTSGVCTSGGYYDYGSCNSDGKWDSGLKTAPDSFSQKFDMAGTFRYYCTVHTSAMTGTIQVQP